MEEEKKEEFRGGLSDYVNTKLGFNAGRVCDRIVDCGLLVGSVLLVWRLFHHQSVRHLLYVMVPFAVLRLLNVLVDWLFRDLKR